MRILQLLLVVALVCAGVCAFPQGGTDRATGRIQYDPLPAARPINAQWLILIGIDDYQNDKLDGLRSCKSDARMVRETLIDYFGYREENVIELYDAQATAAKLRQTFYELPERISEEDSVLIYFAGHGYFESRRQMGFWYAYDAQGVWDGIANSVVKDWCRALPAKKVLVVADSCFAGSLMTRSGFFSDATLRSRELLASGGLHPVADTGSPDGAHSIFSYYLVKNLRSMAELGEPFALTDLYVRIVPPVKANSRQEPQRGIIQDTFHEGGQFLFYPTVRMVESLNTLPSIDHDESAGPESPDMSRAKAEWQRLSELERDKNIKPREVAAAFENYTQEFKETDWKRTEALDRAKHWQSRQNTPIGMIPIEFSPSPSRREITSIQLTNELVLNMVYIPPGQFLMGSDDSERSRVMSEMRPKPEWIRTEYPQTSVRISRGFWMSETEITIAQFAQFLYETGNGRGVNWLAKDSPIQKTSIGYRPSGYGMGEFPDQPMVYVCWTGALDFCEWLSMKTNQSFSLPTEAQWEYACRAGAEGMFSFADNAIELDSYAWTKRNSSGVSQRVRQLKPNYFGLYDMHGNVWEWTLDTHGAYPGGEVVDWLSNNGTSERVMRGGCWDTAPWAVRSAHRDGVPVDGAWFFLGFRVVAVSSE